MITGNNVSRSKQVITGIGNAFGGDGIQIVGGVNAGSGNKVTALVSDNVVFQNRDDGIVAPGCGIEDSGANNTVNVTIINNDVKDNGIINPDLIRNAGIAVSEDGIDILSTGYTLSNNRANRNAIEGIDAAGNTDSRGNTARRNASCNTPGCF